MRAKMEGKLHGSETRDSNSRDEQQGRRYTPPFNYYSRCRDFLSRFTKMHFNQLISYWMMGGILGTVDSTEEAYQKGLDTLHDLIYEQGVLKVSDGDKDMIEFVESEKLKYNPCTHWEFCIDKCFCDYDFLDFAKIWNVMLVDGELKKRQVTIIWDHLKYLEACRYFTTPLTYLAHSNPTVHSLKPLLEHGIADIQVLLLRGCESLPPADFPLQILESLTVLEISGSSYLTTIPENTISQLRNLRHLHLSDLLIESLPDDFFRRFHYLGWLRIRNCSKLSSLPPVDVKRLEVLDLSYCTALQELVPILTDEMGRLRMVDLSYTAFTDMPFLVSDEGVTQLYLRGSKLTGLDFLTMVRRGLRVLDLSGSREVKHIDEYNLSSNLLVLDLSRTQIEFLKFRDEEDASERSLRIMILQDCSSLQQLPSMRYMPHLEILDISGCDKLVELPEEISGLRSLTELNLCGCSGLGILREGIFDQMTCLEKLDLSGTKFKHLPSFANLTSLSALSLRHLELDSLETFKSLPNLVQLDLKGLKITSSQELQLDEFLESLEKLQILNLSQTSVAKLPNMSKLASLRELILADCQRLIAVPDLQTLPNLEVLDLSLADGSDVSCQAEIEFEAQSGVWYSAPSSLQKLVLTNRSGVQKLFPLTSLGSLEFLDLRGTDVTSIPRHYVEQIKCIRLPDQIKSCEVGPSKENLPQVINLDGTNTIQGRVSKPVEIHIVCKLENKYVSNSNEDSCSDENSPFDKFIDEFEVLEDLISEMQENFKSTTASDKNQSLKLQILHSDLKHIQKNIDRLKSSQNCKISDELLRELMGAATHLSAAEFVEDSSSFMQLLRIVVKLKLLIPRTEAELPESSEITKTKKKKKKAWFEKSKNKEEEENGVDIATELMSSNEYQDLLSSYEALTAIEKQCLLCFSVFPCNDQVL